MTSSDDEYIQIKVPKKHSTGMDYELPTKLLAPTALQEDLDGAERIPMINSEEMVHLKPPCPLVRAETIASRMDQQFPGYHNNIEVMTERKNDNENGNCFGLRPMYPEIKPENDVWGNTSFSSRVFQFGPIRTPKSEESKLNPEGEKLLPKPLVFPPHIKWSDVNASSPTSPISPSSPDAINFFRRYKNKRNPASKFPKRGVLKNGECNILRKSTLSRSRLRYVQDCFTTLVDVKWRYTLLIFALSFICSWLSFAGLYWLIAYAHGDFERLDDENWTPCVVNLISFSSCFLFSVETQHTIGYGGRSTTEECPEAIFVMCMQSIMGVMISAAMAGIFFAKMARPKQRRQTLLFSRKAVICLRNGNLCLMFRVGDIRKSHIIGTNISAYIFRTRTTREGEELLQYQSELSVSADGCDSNPLFIWPLTVVHTIEKNSPLYNISANELINETFEIVTVLEGTVESTGQTTQARSSYLASEIKWGHRFESILSYNEEKQSYETDYKKFNNTLKTSTPLCSAKDLDDIYSM